MAVRDLNEPTMWLITLSSKRELSDKDRDFIADLVSEEDRSVSESYSFILHDIVESKRYCKILIEGTDAALTNLLSVIKDNLPYRITYRRHML